ncbi:MAG: coenzyme F420-0:L-glutamate ligase [Patescibacteria group bacterium]
MRVQSIKTRLFLPPKDNVYSELLSRIKRLPENSVVAVASKVVSLQQGRCILRSAVEHKDDLIAREAEKYLPRRYTPNRFAVLTVKYNTLIPTAGIDESNAGDYYILWPKKPEPEAWAIRRLLMKKFKIKKLGVIIVDSHTVPLRRGVLGVALSYAGFVPINDYRGTKDLFGRKFKISSVDIPDALATAAVLEMGEGTERTPAAVISDIPFVKFLSRKYRAKNKYSTWAIPWEEDLYGPLLKAVRWRKGRRQFGTLN